MSLGCMYVCCKYEARRLFRLNGVWVNRCCRIEEELESLMSAFSGIATASYRRGQSIISLICNVKKTSAILERVFRVLGREDVVVQMLSQGASKTNISLIVSDGEAKHALRCLHMEFFGSL